MGINDELMDILIDRVLSDIGTTVDRTIGDKYLTEIEYTQLWNAYRKELLSELK